jgi:inorganic phosphate transporter, PiT family
VGSGLGRRLAKVRWTVARRMALAWGLTLPAAGVVGALAWKGATRIGGQAGVIIIFLAAVAGAGAGAGAVYLASRRSPVNPSNVNDERPDQRDKPREPVGAAAA